MNLLHRHERKLSGADRRLKQLAIFHDIFLGIPFDKAEVEHALPAQRARATSSRAESVDEPRKLRKWHEFEDLQSPRLAQSPWNGKPLG